jgi:ABC-type nickel/cobalt efflux system permease component RcnA
MGNFTINVSAGLVVRPDAVVLSLVVDMAEIPAFQEIHRLDRNANGRVEQTESAAYREQRCVSLADNLELAIDGETTTLSPAGTELHFPPGAGGLSTLRLECRLGASVALGSGPTRIAFSDSNFPGRVGWHEVTITGDEVTIVDSDVPRQSSTDDLRRYPTGVIPLDVRAATATVRPGGPPLAHSRSSDGGSQTSPRDGNLLERLVGRENISLQLALFSIAVAFGVGAVHALGPGHGKALAGAYLVATGAGLRRAAALGISVSIMHTAAVLGVGALVLSLEKALPAERVYPWLGLASGIGALCLGSALVFTRIAAIRGTRRRAREHDHHHHIDRPFSGSGVVAIAAAGGILPSPSALVVLLTSISLGRTAFGLALIAAFGFGLATSLVAVSAATLGVRGLAARALAPRVMRAVPILSALLMVALGAALTYRGIDGLV